MAEGGLHAGMAREDWHFLQIMETFGVPIRYRPELTSYEGVISIAKIPSEAI